MLLWYWFSSENTPVTELFGNGTVSGQDIFGCVDSVDSVPYTTGSCKMMFPISYLVYSVNYRAYLLITYLVYSVNYLVCLLITTRTNQSGEYNR